MPSLLAINYSSSSRNFIYKMNFLGLSRKSKCYKTNHNACTETGLKTYCWLSDDTLNPLLHTADKHLVLHFQSRKSITAYIILYILVQTTVKDHLQSTFVNKRTFSFILKSNSAVTASTSGLSVGFDSVFH